jgi:hypothetical protein
VRYLGKIHALLAVIVISLQKDASEEAIATLRDLVTGNGGQLINAAAELCDLAVTAAWIAASDRLLTCDTSVAHVGGAIGHPTTVFARNKAIWQWLRNDRVNQGVASAAVWYDSALVQYALAPEISWLFTTIKKPAELTNDKSAFPTEDAELSSTEIRTPRLRGQFRFAGRPE